jgi:hypothetical protein
MIASRLSEIALANWVDGQYIMHNSLCAKYINGKSIRVHPVRLVRLRRIKILRVRRESSGLGRIDGNKKTVSWLSHGVNNDVRKM